MKALIALMTLGLLSSALSQEAAAGKKVTITPKDFSEIYPAVWFCPDDATITSLKEKSEKPPHEKFRIWIEPSDPEFNVTPAKADKNKKAFVYLGEGKVVFEKASFGDKGEEHVRLGRSELMKDQPVFIYREGDKQWAFMIEKVDREKETLSFVWRQLHD